MALALAGLAVAAVLGLMTSQAATRAQARGRLQALAAARQVMDQWLSRPSLRPGTYRGRSPEGMAWQVRVTTLASTRPWRGTRTSPPPAFTTRRGTQELVLMALEVCCTYRLAGGQRRLCLQSRRLAHLEK